MQVSFLSECFVNKAQHCIQIIATQTLQQKWLMANHQQLAVMEPDCCANVPLQHSQYSAVSVFLLKKTLFSESHYWNKYILNKLKMQSV